VAVAVVAELLLLTKLQQQQFKMVD
jgi:hypothetical protein